MLKNSINHLHEKKQKNKKTKKRLEKIGETIKKTTHQAKPLEILKIIDINSVTIEQKHNNSSSFNSTLQLISGISSDLQKLFTNFNGTTIFVFLKITFSPSTTVFPNNLTLNLKDLKLVPPVNTLFHLQNTSISYLSCQNDWNFIPRDYTLA